MSRPGWGEQEGQAKDLAEGQRAEYTALHERLRNKIFQMPEGRMQISPDQGQLMALFVKLMGATNILEIGSFIGYSALIHDTVPASRGEVDSVRCQRRVHRSGIAILGRRGRV